VVRGKGSKVANGKPKENKGHDNEVIQNAEHDAARGLKKMVG